MVRTGELRNTEAPVSPVRTSVPESTPSCSAIVTETDCIPPTTRRSRMKSSSTRLENEPAEAAMSTACRAENAWDGLVSMPPAMKMPMLLHASSSSEFCRSQSLKDTVSSSRALGWAHGSVGPISAARSSISWMSRSISFSVPSEVGNMWPSYRCRDPSGAM